MPGYVNGIPHATSTDRLDLWPTTSRNLAQWVDENALRNDDPRLSDARPPTTHEHGMEDVTGLTGTIEERGLTPDGRLPSAAEAHALEIADAKYGTLLAPEIIGATEHLDTRTTPGKGRTISSTIAGDTSLGYPEGAVHGVLFVEYVAAPGGDPYLLQTWTDTWNIWTARRRRYSGSWSEWVRDPSSASVEALIGPVEQRVAALESASDTPVVQDARTVHVTSDYRPDAFAAPDGTVSYWTGPSGVERIPWTYRGEGYVGRIGGAAGYTSMRIVKTNSVQQLEVSCLNPTTGRHITHRIAGPSGSSDDQRRFIDAFVGPYSGNTATSDLAILPRSNIEWAFQIDVDGNEQFAPHHGTNSAKAWQYEPPVFTDAHGTVIDVEGMATNTPVTVDGLKIRQRLYLTHPDTGDTRWAAVDEVRTIAPDGMIQSEAVVTFLEDTTLGNNYGTMTPVAGGTFDQLHILDGATYPVATTPPAVTEYLSIAEKHQGTSALFTSTSNPSAFVAMAILDPDATYRRGDPQEETSAAALRLELRSTGLVKLYPQSFADGSVIPAGTVWRIGAQWRYGETENPSQYA